VEIRVARRLLLACLGIGFLAGGGAAQDALERIERDRRLGERLAELEQAAQGPASDPKIAAMVRLVAEPHTRAVRPIAKLLSDPEDAVARAAAEAIAYLGVQLQDPLELQRAVNILAATVRMAKGRPVVAAAACTGLGWLRHREAIPPLVEALGSPAPAVAAAATAALQRLTGLTHPTPDAWGAWWAGIGATYTLPPADGQGPGPSPPKPPAPEAGDPVTRAIDRAADWLLTRHEASRPYVDREAVQLLALAYAGRDNDPRFRAAVEALAVAPLVSVYEVGLQCMVLAKDDPKRWQQQIAARAWWLVNSQCESGAWSYGGPDRGLPVPTQHPRAALTQSRFGAIVAQGHLRAGDDPMQTILLERAAPWARLPSHDLSNTQIAVLALHAAEQAHVRAPDETWQRIEQAYADGCVNGGGWAYIILRIAVPTASMTAGAIGTLAMVDDVFDEETAKRKALKRVGWALLDKLGPFAEWRGGRANPNGDMNSVYFYYWLYSLERAGVLEHRAKLGGRDWFKVLADYLVKAQRPDGAWGPPDNHTGRTIIGSWEVERAICTSFAVLFLARAAPLRRTQLTKSVRSNPPAAPPAPAPVPDGGDGPPGGGDPPEPGAGG
jgi:hypothetical protein